MNRPAAPVFHCDCCHRLIGKRSTHFLANDNRIVLCGRCVMPRSTHDRIYPDCPAAWHDMHDHGPVVFATRAAARRILTNPEGTPP